jgi:hypothetical protein
VEVKEGLIRTPKGNTNINTNADMASSITERNKNMGDITLTQKQINDILYFTREVPDARPPECLDYKYPDDFPKVSVSEITPVSSIH